MPVIVTFELYSDGTFWCGRAVGADIFTQGKTLDELMYNIREAIRIHFDEGNSTSQDTPALL